MRIGTQEVNVQWVCCDKINFYWLIIDQTFETFECVEVTQFLWFKGPPLNSKSKPVQKEPVFFIYCVFFVSLKYLLKTITI